MLTRKLFDRLFTILVLASLVLSGAVPVLAQGPGTQVDRQRYIKKLEDWRQRAESRITPADRQAAAQRAAKAKLKLAEIGAAQMAVPGAAPHYFSHPNYANSPLPSFPLTPTVSFTPTYKLYLPVIYSGPISATIAGGIRKFVDRLPGLTSAGANNLGQYIPVAVPDQSTYPGSDYYEIALVEYQEQMHSDLPPTKLRGYVQVNGGDPNPHYLGPTIVAQKDRPVRVKFDNQLPTGEGGNLFLPVDTTVMGAGPGPNMDMAMPDDPLKPMCGELPKDPKCYSENRATLHLHGGITPWISDGTPHQWITPAGESTDYPQGVSVIPVPGMGDSGNANDGTMTFYYTNEQSARLMFYHDHAWGITRLNVYAGEAAPYLIRDDTENALVSQGIIPPYTDEIPLVVQDKTFVPSERQLAAQDDTWDLTRWGGPGDLWAPHVYMPNQNPGDSSGTNAFGRWDYGPWFHPPTQSIDHGPIANPYYDPNCNPDVTWCEPPVMPGTPYNSMGMEAFNDTPVVNGTAYPTLTVDPKSYRFRILNAANDRMFNLQLYQAIDAKGVKCDRNNPNPAAESTGVACTEVALNPAEVAAAQADPLVFPTPLGGAEGPNFIQIGTEGGFLPAPVEIAPQPITWVTDMKRFDFGNVDKHSLLVAPAERVDVIVDFSQFAGQTLILYNDAPAAFPARDPRYDYYTGHPDMRDTGGAPSTLPGYGPNTRTVMQIKVNATSPAPAFNKAALQAAFAHHADGSGVFESAQDPIIVGQGAYNSAYGTSFQTNGPNAGLVQIFDTSTTFTTLLGPSLTFPLQPKAIHDEMGAAYDQQYGRMSGMLGVEAPTFGAGLQTVVLNPYTFPSPDVLKGVEVTGTANSLVVTPISTTVDGTQIWRITHNGVDTHPIHWHLYEVQVLNRVGWDGAIRKPDANELGWKDTVRVSPLEDTIVAIRPILPHYPFDLPNSIRELNPAMPDGAVIADPNASPNLAFNPAGEPIGVNNHLVNFGNEYVWHCHILSHEEMDMMHAQSIAIAPIAPANLVVTTTATSGELALTWDDTSLNETSWQIQRAGETVATIPSTTGPALGQVTYTDVVPVTATLPITYQVLATNLVGDDFVYTAPGADFPTISVDSAPSNVATAP